MSVPVVQATGLASRRVSTRQCPNFKAFYRQHPLSIILDTGAETSMIRSSIARSIGAPIVKSTQHALQADGVTPLAVVGETHLILSRGSKNLALDALVVDDLDVDVLAGTPFLSSNDISIRPALRKITIQESDVIFYDPSPRSSGSHTVRRTQAFCCSRSGGYNCMAWRVL